MARDVKEGPPAYRLLGKQICQLWFYFIEPKPGDIKLIFVAPKENKQSIFNKSQNRKKQPKIQKYFYLKYMSVMLIQLPYCSNSCLVISLGSGHKKYNKQFSRCCIIFSHELTCQILTNQSIKIGRRAWPTRDHGKIRSSPPVLLKKLAEFSLPKSVWNQNSNSAGP